MARWLGVSVRAVADWEAGRRAVPGPAARALSCAGGAGLGIGGEGGESAGSSALGELAWVAETKPRLRPRVEEAVLAGARCRSGAEREVLWRARALELGGGAAVGPPPEGRLGRGIAAFRKRPGERLASYLERLWADPLAWAAKRALWEERRARWAAEQGEVAERIVWGLGRLLEAMEAVEHKKRERRG